MTNRPLLTHGPRIALSPMHREDQPLFRAWLAGQPDLRRLIGDERVPTDEDQEKWFARSREADRCLLSILRLPEGHLIGNGGFVHIDPERRTAEFRITIGDAQSIGKGYGTEATHLLLTHGFQELALSRVHLRVLPFNERAVRMYRKFSFVEQPNDGSPRGLLMTLDRSSFSLSSPTPS